MNLGTTSKSSLLIGPAVTFLVAGPTTTLIVYPTFTHFHNKIPYIHIGVVNDNLTKYEVCSSKYYSYCL
jgi:hypothetical protein